MAEYTDNDHVFETTHVTLFFPNYIYNRNFSQIPDPQRYKNKRTFNYNTGHSGHIEGQNRTNTGCLLGNGWPKANSSTLILPLLQGLARRLEHSHLETVKEAEQQATKTF